jgi:serine protease AprX
MARSPDPTDAFDPATGGTPTKAPRPGDKLAKYVLSPQVERLFKGRRTVRVRMIIEVNLDRVDDVETGKLRVRELLLEVHVPEACIQPLDRSYNYVFARLTRKESRALVRQDEEHGEGRGTKRVIRRIWPDAPLTAYINRSVRTVKGDACRIAFGAEGEGVVWAVVDSGVQKDHPHFASSKTTELPDGLEHKNFLDDADSDPLVDNYGHGTHVAGVLAGETCYVEKGMPMYRLAKRRDEQNTVHTVVEEIKTTLRGVAVKTKIMSLKAIDDKGNGYASALIAALEYVARLNGDGRNIRIHGVNLSLGYKFDAEWYAAGHSQVCAVVNRLSKDGVVVVAASGNDGSAFLQTEKTDRNASRRRRPVDQRSRQRRRGHHRRLHACRGAAHLRRLLLLLSRPDRRRAC